jgi:penicillin-binding protein 1A
MEFDIQKWRKPLLIGALSIAIIVTGTGLGFVTASIKTMPSLNGGMKADSSSQVYDINGKLVATIHAAENRLPVPLAKIPKHLQYAFIASEDVRFYQHHGVDVRGIFRALFTNITSGGLHEGASTLTQQLARNTLLTHDQTLKRKVQEAILALQIERKFTKQEILEMYLNQIYFGQGAYGVQAAAQIYFGKNVEELTVAESAMLAGVPRSPNYYSPSSNIKAAKEVQATVLDQMIKYNYLTSSEAQKAKEVPIQISKSTQSNAHFASYFIDYVTQILVDRYGADAVYKEGLKIYTTLDIDAQRAAEKAIAQLPTYRSEKGGIKQPQGALVAIEPQTGYIKAMVGGRGDDQFNRAVQAERQPGSSFKPFVYLTGLENGLTAATLIDDSQVTFGTWSPVNYDKKFRGPISMREALEKSINTVSVKITDQVGVDKVLNTAQRLGITSLVLSGSVNDRNLSTSLGGLTSGVSPLQMASAYGTIANQGVRAEPMAIIKVVDRHGAVLEQRTPKQRAVMKEQATYILTDMMRGVIQRGTGMGANIGRPAAGKTGTTNDYVDAWFVGFTPDLACAVWMGLDSNGSLEEVTGGDLPASMWGSFMAEALAKVPARDFPRPSGIVSVLIDPRTGLLANPNTSVEPTKPVKPAKPDKPGDKPGDKPADKPGDAKTTPSKSDEPIQPVAREEIFIQGTQPTQFSPPVVPTPPTPTLPGDNKEQPTGAKPGTKPKTTPGTTPSTTPSTMPSTTPSTVPSTTPSTAPSTTPSTPPSSDSSTTKPPTGPPDVTENKSN